jgi:hypothetical protein
MKRLLTIVFAFLLAHQTVEAAEISIVAEETPNHPAIMLIKGMFMKDDYQKDVILFTALTVYPKNAIIFLEGPGGKLQTALEIGLRIYQRGFSTAVADGATCTSACALAWLGGKDRFIGKDARIGFHSARVGTTNEISSVGNAMAGAYLAQIGIKELATIAFLTKAPPGSMEWLDLSNAIRFHITANAFSLSQDSWSWANQAFQHPPVKTDAPAAEATAIGTTGRVIRWTFPKERFPIEHLTTLPPAPPASKAAD